MGATVFRNGSLFDGFRYRGPVGAVVIEGGMITAVLRTHEVGEIGDLAGRNAVEVDLAGGLLAPGFVDAHVHTVQGGLERIRCDLSGLRTREEYLSAIGAYAARHPELTWILGGGWSQTAFPGGTPLAAELDRVVPDRPVFLPNRDHHGAWVNSQALERAGIGDDTPDPPHGRFERDAAGRPSGTLHEGAMRVVSKHLPDTTDEEYDRALLAGQAYLHSVGVVGWQDAIVGDYAGMDDAGPTYSRAAQRGELTADVVGALWWERDLGLEQVGSLVRRRSEYSHGHFRATSVKIMLDGVVENGTAALGAAYLDGDPRRTGKTGHLFVDPQVLAAGVARLEAEGFQVHVHAIGDRAVREA
ncbi:MAG TPA: amidohydrolase family protein, partial [Jiangellaceae bacterium]